MSIKLARQNDAKVPRWTDGGPAWPRG